jgi:hypothetical protein
MVINGWGGLSGDQFSPNDYRSLQKSGQGGIADFLGVSGKPGPHNWLEFTMSRLQRDREGGYTFIMVPEMAKHLYEYGFKSKDEVYDYLYKRHSVPLSEYRKWSWPHLTTNGWTAIEKTTGKPWHDLPDDFNVHISSEPRNNCVIVAGGDEECCFQLEGRRPGTDPVYSIDAWR